VRFASPKSKDERHDDRSLARDPSLAAHQRSAERVIDCAQQNEQCCRHARLPAAALFSVGSCVAHPTGVLTLLMLWLIAALNLAAVLAIDDRFGRTAYARVLLVAVAASGLAALINRCRQRAPQPVESPPAITLPAREQRLSPAPELDLAIEHIQSIRVLLDVSSSHNQPVPRAVFVNLDLVLKHLRKLNGVSSHPDVESAPSTKLMESEPAFAPDR
jgi:hypothetical protein